MTGRNRRNFSPEFRLEAAQLVLDLWRAFNVQTVPLKSHIRMDMWCDKRPVLRG